MTGRMEIEVKYTNNIDRLLKNEPEYMELFNVFMIADDKTAKTRLNYINNVTRLVHYLKDSGLPTETIDDIGRLNVEIIRKYIVDDDNHIIMKNGKISDSYKYIRYFSLKLERIVFIALGAVEMMRFCIKCQHIKMTALETEQKKQLQQD